MLPKECSKCGIPKSIELDFYKQASGRIGTTCKVCISTTNQTKYANNPKLYRTRVKTHSRSNPDVERTHSLSKFGLSTDEFKAMLDSQNGTCEVCDKVETKNKASWDGTRSLSVDHCQASGKIRALLCLVCNATLARVKEMPARLRAQAEYLEDHGADPSIPYRTSKEMKDDKTWIKISKKARKLAREAQGGVCAICKLPEVVKNNVGTGIRDLCEDHDHRTGKFRALLCNDCNTALGLVEDNPILLHKLADYLETADTGFRIPADLLARIGEDKAEKQQKPKNLSKVYADPTVLAEIVADYRIALERGIPTTQVALKTKYGISRSVIRRVLRDAGLESKLGAPKRKATA